MIKPIDRDSNLDSCMVVRAFRYGGGEFGLSGQLPDHASLTTESNWGDVRRRVEMFGLFSMQSLPGLPRSKMGSGSSTSKTRRSAECSTGYGSTHAFRLRLAV